MSLGIIKNQLLKFISDPAPEVISLKGKWGTGKTYSWNFYLKQAHLDKRIALEKYAYVSLFGIDSLQALKFTIFENTLSKSLISEKPSIETFEKNAVDSLGVLSKRAISIFKNTSIIDKVSTAIDSISFLSVNKTLICIDDIERKGKNIEIKDVLGLVSLLKEQKDCKIILILNEDEISDGYLMFCEKVIAGKIEIIK